MTTIISTTSYDRAIALALEVQPRVRHQRGLSYFVMSTTNKNIFHRVRLAEDGSLVGATCTCEGKNADSCKHRAASYMWHQGWLETTEGQEWAEKHYCLECGLRAKMDNSDLCNWCAQPVTDYASYAEQIKQDEYDLFGSVA